MSSVSKNEVFAKGSIVPKTLFDGQTDGYVFNESDYTVIEAACIAYSRYNLEEKISGLGFTKDRAEVTHAVLFGGLNPHAGKTRDYDLDSDHASPEEFDEIFDDIELKLLELEWFDPATKINRDDFVKEIADIYAQVNYASIFPTGNDTINKEFINSLTQDAGFFLDPREANEKDWQQASYASLQGDQTQLRSLFDQMVTHNPLQLDAKKKGAENDNSVQDNMTEENRDAKTLVKGFGRLTQLGVDIDFDSIKTPDSLTKNNSESEIVKKNSREQSVGYPSFER